MELPLGCNPANCAIRPDNPELRRVRTHACFGFGDRFCNLRSILCVYATIKIFHSAAEIPRGQSKHGLQVPEPAISPSLKIPFPTHGLAGLHGQTKPIISQNDFVLRELALCDVRYHAHNPEDSALLVEVCPAGPVHPNQGPVGMYHAIADLQLGILSTKPSHRELKSLLIVRMNLGEY